MTIAVTGATGQLGSLTVRHLLDAGEKVVAVVRDPARAADLEAAGAEVRVAAYGDVPALTAALAGVDVVGLVSGNEIGSRVAQHASVVEAAQAAGVTRIVYTSAPKALDTDLVLAPEHAATERLLAESGLATTILRNNWYIENYAPTVAAARATGEVVSAAGDGVVPSAPRDDFARALAVVLAGEGHEGRVYELAGTQRWTTDDLAAALGELFGTPVTHRRVTPAELTEVLVGAGLDGGSAGFVAALDANIATGALDVDDDTLQTLIGRPTAPLVEQLRPLV